MKTVPTVRLADASDTAGLPELPEEIQLAMSDIAGVAREGLLAMSVAAGMAVMQAMFEAEIAAACGPKGRHDPSRAAVRHGRGAGLGHPGRPQGCGDPTSSPHRQRP
jgi:2-methylcitrate dehydratase PrpD